MFRKLKYFFIIEKKGFFFKLSFHDREMITFLIQIHIHILKSIFLKHSIAKIIILVK
jgi:hypothetical protein